MSKQNNLYQDEDDQLSSSGTDEYDYTLFTDPRLLLQCNNSSPTSDKPDFSESSSTTLELVVIHKQTDAFQATRHITVAAGIVSSINVTDDPVIVLRSGAKAVLRKKIVDGPWVMAKVCAHDSDIEIQLNGLEFSTEGQP